MAFVFLGLALDSVARMDRPVRKGPSVTLIVVAVYPQETRASVMIKSRSVGPENIVIIGPPTAIKTELDSS